MLSNNAPNLLDLSHDAHREEALNLLPRDADRDMRWSVASEWGDLDMRGGMIDRSMQCLTSEDICGNKVRDCHHLLNVDIIDHVLNGNYPIPPSDSQVAQIIFLVSNYAEACSSVRMNKEDDMSRLNEDVDGIVEEAWEQGFPIRDQIRLDISGNIFRALLYGANGIKGYLAKYPNIANDSWESDGFTIFSRDDESVGQKKYQEAIFSLVLRGVRARCVFNSFFRRLDCQSSFSEDMKAEIFAAIAGDYLDKGNTFTELLKSSGYSKDTLYQYQPLLIKIEELYGNLLSLYPRKIVRKTVALKVLTSGDLQELVNRISLLVSYAKHQIN